MRKWQCIVCGWIYDEAEGCEEEDIPPGTPWENVPDDFVCRSVVSARKISR